MEFELRQENVRQVGEIVNLGGTLRKLSFNYRASVVGLPNNDKYNFREFTGSIEIDLNDTGITYETAMFVEAASLVALKYPTI